MMKCKFEQGDKVIIDRKVMWSGWVAPMDKWVGCEGSVVNRMPDPHSDGQHPMYFVLTEAEDEHKSRWWYPETALIPTEDRDLAPVSAVSDLFSGNLSHG